MNAIESILRVAGTRNADPALAYGSLSMSYRELADLVTRTASHLRSLGFMPGKRVGVCLKDTPDHLVVILALGYLGCVAVPLDWRARPAENCRFIEALSLDAVFIEPASPLVPPCPALTLNESWRRGVAQNSAASSIALAADEPFLISATSGSTGLPRFSVMTHRQFHSAAAGMLELMDLTAAQRFLCTLPLYYSGGRNSCLVHLMRGDSVVLYPSLFTPEEFVSQVRLHEVTVAALVPSTIRQLLAAPACAYPALRSLHRLFCTGAPLYPEEKHEALRRLSPMFFERYGTAETLAISVLRPEEVPIKAASVGRPHSHVRVEIVDESGNLMPAGSEGRMRIRGNGIATSLPGQPDDSRFRDGCFYPGEIAHCDEDGFIFLHGRTSDVIIRKGTKIFPAEVERVLVEHPSIVESAVIGHTAQSADEVLVAFIVPRDNLSLGEVLAHCRSRLAPHKVPQAIHFLTQLPRNTAGKVDKHSLTTWADKEIPSSVKNLPPSTDS